MSRISFASQTRTRTGLWNDTPGNEGGGSTLRRFGRIERMVRPWCQLIEKKFEICK
jgi:hypothetical protein